MAAIPDRRGHEDASGATASVSVVLRVRPPLPHEAAHGQCTRVVDGRRFTLTTSVEAKSRIGASQPPKVQQVECTYDKVLDMMASQEDVWGSVSKVVEKALDGYNATVFTYGMTGTGKTYTMLGPGLMDAAFEGTSAPSAEELGACKRRGLVPRVVERIFRDIAGGGDAETKVSLSYLQIYQERCFDLLRPAASAAPLRLREDAGAIYAEGLTEAPVETAEACHGLLIYGFSNIAFRATAFNEQSSRSHSVLTLTIERRGRGAALRKSRIHLVDLAGNERWDTFGPEMDRSHTKELTAINRSLHVLGSCVQALTQPPAVSKKDGRQIMPHVPYRDSALTMILRDSLSGNSFITMLCTVCSCSLYQVQTLCTLRFADRAKRMQLQARRCDVTDPKALLQTSKAEIAYLRGLVAEAGVNGDLQQHMSRLETKNNRLEGENKTLKEQLVALRREAEKARMLASAAFDVAGGRSMDALGFATAEVPLPLARRLRRAISEPALPSASGDDGAGEGGHGGYGRGLETAAAAPGRRERSEGPPRARPSDTWAPGPLAAAASPRGHRASAGAPAAEERRGSSTGGPGLHEPAPPPGPRPPQQRQRPRTPQRSCSQTLASQLEAGSSRRTAGRLVGRCPAGHELVPLGSVLEPCGHAAYAEWNCDSGACSVGSLQSPGALRYHCADCMHDLCGDCFVELAQGASVGRVSGGLAGAELSRDASSSAYTEVWPASAGAGPLSPSAKGASLLEPHLAWGFGGVGAQRGGGGGGAQAARQPAGTDPGPWAPRHGDAAGVRHPGGDAYAQPSRPPRRAARSTSVPRRGATAPTHGRGPAAVPATGRRPPAAPAPPPGLPPRQLPPPAAAQRMGRSLSARRAAPLQQQGLGAAVSRSLEDQRRHQRLAEYYDAKLVAEEEQRQAQRQPPPRQPPLPPAMHHAGGTELHHQPSWRGVAEGAPAASQRSQASAASGGMARSWESTAPGTPESSARPSPRGGKGGVRLPAVASRSADADDAVRASAASAASLAATAVGGADGALSTPRRRERLLSEASPRGSAGASGLPLLPHIGAAPVDAAPAPGAFAPSGCADPGGWPRTRPRSGSGDAVAQRLQQAAPAAPAPTASAPPQPQAREVSAMQQRAADSQELAARSVAAAQQLAALHARLGLDTLLPAREALTATAAAAAAASSANAAAAAAASAASALLAPRAVPVAPPAPPALHATAPSMARSSFRAPAPTFEALSSGKAGLGSLLGDIDAQRKAASAAVS